MFHILMYNLHRRNQINFLFCIELWYNNSLLNYLRATITWYGITETVSLMLINDNKERCASPIPMSARSKTWVCGCSLTGIVGSNPAGGMDVSCECCVLSGRGLCVGLITRQRSSTGWYVCVCLSVMVKSR